MTAHSHSLLTVNVQSYSFSIFANVGVLIFSSTVTGFSYCHIYLKRPVDCRWTLCIESDIAYILIISYPQCSFAS